MCTGGATSGSRCSRTRRSRGGSSRWRARTDRSRRGGRRHVCDAPRSRSPAAGRTPRPNAHDCVRVDGGRTRRRPAAAIVFPVGDGTAPATAAGTALPPWTPGFVGGIATLSLFARRRRRDHTDGNLAAPRPFRGWHVTLDLTPAANPRANRLFLGCRCRRPRARSRSRSESSSPGSGPCPEQPSRTFTRWRLNRVAFSSCAKSGDMRNAKIVCTIGPASDSRDAIRSATSPTRGCPSSG